MKRMEKYLLLKKWMVLLPLCLVCISASAQQPSSAGKQNPKRLNVTRRITGVVLDDAGDPVIGATVSVKNNPSKKTITDVDGHYTLDGISSNDVLEVTYLGLAPKDVVVGNLAIVNISLSQASKELNEVVVVGAGTQKKVSVTGSISTIKGSELRAPSSSLTNNLAGKLAGVISVQGSGEPGTSSQFYIRGIGTFGGRTTPLILLDDIEISVGDLDGIPPENIKSFSILKDASATAIYGARGANGVMLVTTKSGSYNTKASIKFTFENSFFKPVHKVKFTDGATFMEMANEAILTRDPTATPRYTDEQIQNTRNKVNPYVYPDVDWYDLLFKNYNMNQRANLNIQGGGERMTYYMSIQANHDTGLLNVPKNYSYDSNQNQWNYILQTNLSYDLTKNTVISLRMNAQIGSLAGPNYSTSDLFYQAFNVDPVSFPAYFPQQGDEGHINFGNAILTGDRLFTNPYAYMVSSYKKTNYSTLNTSFDLLQKLDFITKGLNVKLLVNYKSYNNVSYTRTIEPYYYRVKEGSWSADNPTAYELERLGSSGTDYISQSGLNRTSDYTFYLDGRLNWARSFGGHNLTAMLMYMMREFRSSTLPHRNQGYSARLTYDYMNKYLVEINMGYTGTERLKNHRFEFFPAMSIGWVPSSEKFWEPISKYVDFLKLRASYGLVGSDETGENAGAAHFLYVNGITLGGSGVFRSGDTNNIERYGPGINSYAVLDAHWERVKKLDLGFDIKLFNQIDVIFDYFKDHRDRILMQRGSWPKLLGYWTAVPWSNVGKVENHGFDLSVNWNKQFNRNLSMDLRFNMSYNKNKYEYRDEPDYPYVWQTTTGKPLNARYGYIAEGLFKDKHDIATSPIQNLGSEVKPGDIKYRDVNGDGQITSEDKVMISPYGSIPRLQYGIGADFNWKHFDFGVFFTGSAKRENIISGFFPFVSDEGHGNRSVFSFITRNRWTENNPDPNAEYPRLGYTSQQVANNNQPSTYWLRDMSFVRWKTIELGYTLPWGRVYISGDNIAVWSKFKDWDPAIWWNTYPLSRTWNLGIQLHF